MKRVLVLALPILVTSFVLGLGVFLLRERGDAIQARFGAARKTVGGIVEEVAEQVEEVLE